MLGTMAYLCVWCKSQVILTSFNKYLTNARKLLVAKSTSVHCRDSMSEMQCQRLNVSDSVWETQSQRLNIRDSMSQSDVLIWWHTFATRPSWVYHLILVYKGIVYLWSWVFHSWCAARPLVNADWLLQASRSRQVSFSTSALSAESSLKYW